MDNASRLLFTASRDELYNNLRQDALTDSIVMAILRSYTGLFSDYAYIDERLIAKRAGCTPDDVYRLLVCLSKYKIVQYVPEKHTPMIRYRQAVKNNATSPFPVRHTRRGKSVRSCALPK